MYFIPCNTRMLSLVGTVPLAICYMVTMVCYCTIAAVWFFTLYKPLIAHVAEQHAQLTQLNALDLQIQQAAEYHERLSKEISALTDQFNSALPLQDSSDSANNYIVHMLDSANQHGLTLNSFTPGSSVNKNWYTNHTFIAHLQGTFTNIINFFEHIKVGESLIRCKKVTISKIDHEQLQLITQCNLVQRNKDYVAA